MFKKLFVPIDGSSLSQRAIAVSIDLAVQLGAHITGFIVEPDLPLSVASHDAEAFAERIQEHQAKTELHSNILLHQFEVRASQAGVVFRGLSVTSYSVDDIIAEEAEKSGCDMIVIVTHGRGKLGEFVFGSHTKKVISRTKIPVLVLH
ncbi:MAG: universal stress protein [Rhodocyclaceae bacterium]|jgi:nucleotide-binding universal stress UspA family protein|nr:universal stress protein [Rhodocyclaceae bacterium]MCB1892073.1 universal stress protein [Rhodocyclaceae bacterium]MCP5297945.1 universal stress protein [Zoogloeaceae bacterium]MCW5596902.1 universal stress protein [Rhodocyclaceae bacterium]